MKSSHLSTCERGDRGVCVGKSESKRHQRKITKETDEEVGGNRPIYTKNREAEAHSAKACASGAVPRTQRTGFRQSSGTTRPNGGLAALQEAKCLVLSSTLSIQYPPT